MIYFLSDIHLRDDQEPKAQKLIDFLDSHPMEKLFLLGDIFDLWVANGKVFHKKYKRIIDSIQKLVDAGVEIHYFEGNHDLYLKRFWQEKLGVKIYDSAAFFNLGNYLVRMEHGDEANPEDVKYLEYKSIIRGKFLASIAYWIPGNLLDYLGTRASQSSRAEEHRYPWDVSDVLRKHIERVYPEKPFDVLITGHMHRQIDEEIMLSGKAVRNINLGWWGDKPRALVFQENNFRWLEI
tara:strand:- start:10538 stop:11248 length:711 start_codon:yes stop_codon:yes gene_type:complete